MDALTTSIVCDQGIKTLQGLVATLGTDFSADKITQLLQPVKLLGKLQDIQALARAMELELKAGLDGVAITGNAASSTSTGSTNTAASASTNSSQVPIIKL